MQAKRQPGDIWQTLSIGTATFTKMRGDDKTGQGATVKNVKTVKVGSRRRDCQTAFPALIRDPFLGCAVPNTGRNGSWPLIVRGWKSGDPHYELASWARRNHIGRKERLILAL